MFLVATPRGSRRVLSRRPARASGVPSSASPPPRAPPPPPPPPPPPSDATTTTTTTSSGADSPSSGAVSVSPSAFVPGPPTACNQSALAALRALEAKEKEARKNDAVAKVDGRDVPEPEVTKLATTAAAKPAAGDADDGGGGGGDDDAEAKANAAREEESADEGDRGGDRDRGGGGGGDGKADDALPRRVVLQAHRAMGSARVARKETDPFGVF